MIKTVQEMLARLQQHPDVLALVEYGSRQSDAKHGTENAMGDFDLFAILRDEPAVSSLHFYVDGVPVDLGLISLAAVRTLRPENFAHGALLSSRILHGADQRAVAAIAALKQQAETPPAARLAAYDIAFIRHGHKHVLDKVCGRIETMPLLCRFLLHTNIYWLVQNYFRIHGLAWRGEKWAIAFIEEHESEIAELINDFYRAESLAVQVAITETLTALVLAPIGGAWRNDEILAFGEQAGETLQAQGEAMYRSLFGDAA